MSKPKSTTKLGNGIEIVWDIDEIISIPRKAVPHPAKVKAPPPPITDFSATKEVENKPEESSASIVTLPDELLIKIVKLVPQVDAAILGITHSRLYRIVNEVHHRVSLYEVSMGDRRGRNAGFLWQRLEDWMGNRVFSLHADGGSKFVTRQKARMLEEREKSPWKFGAFGKVTWRE